ncbi:hypothetical protein F2Q70_00035786 [Brassica cretica]|uniref:Uncharacterized protein n=1 Tax=Brassica cretica TaxID=69181 RepID=A0A8S9JTI6_BRACR|nr:hypothetical protein F2Q70_00035786 [Brassica cretica]
MPDRNLEVLPQILRSLLGTRRLSGNPEGPYSTSLGKTTTGLEGAGVGVMTQVPGFAAFHVWISRDYETLRPLFSRASPWVLWFQSRRLASKEFPASSSWEWSEKDQYGVYRDDQGCARDVDGHIINVSKEDIRKLMERASKDEHSYICLLEHASSFTQSKLVPEIYTKNEINEMFYGICGEQEKNKEDFQMKHSQNSVCDGRFSPYIDG